MFVMNNCDVLFQLDSEVADELGEVLPVGDVDFIDDCDASYADELIFLKVSKLSAEISNVPISLTIAI